MTTLLEIHKQNSHAVNIPAFQQHLAKLSGQQNISQINMEMINVTRLILDRILVEGGDKETLRCLGSLSEQISRIGSRARIADPFTAFAENIWSIERRPSKSIWEVAQ